MLDGYGVGLGRTSGQNLASEPLGEVQRDGALAESFPVWLEPQVEAYMRPLRPPLIYKRPQGTAYLNVVDPVTYCITSFRASAS